MTERFHSPSHSLPQSDMLISGYDAGQFGGDLGSEVTDNTWEGVPKSGHRRLESEYR